MQLAQHPKPWALAQQGRAMGHPPHTQAALFHFSQAPYSIFFFNIIIL